MNDGLNPTLSSTCSELPAQERLLGRSAELHLFMRISSKRSARRSRRSSERPAEGRGAVSNKSLSKSGQFGCERPVI